MRKNLVRKQIYKWNGLCDIAYKNPNTTTAADTFNKEEFKKAADRELLKSIPDYGLLQLVTVLITEYKDRADSLMFKEEKLEYLKKYLTQVLNAVD